MLTIASIAMPVLRMSVLLTLTVKDGTRFILTRSGFDYPVLYERRLSLSWDVSNPRGLEFDLSITKEFLLLVIAGGPDSGCSAEEGELFINNVSPGPCRPIDYQPSVGSSDEPEPHA